VLESIRRLVEDDEVAVASRLPTLNEMIPRCRGKLDSLRSELEKDLGRKGGMRQALIWPLKESQVNKALDELAKLQGLLTTAMDVDHTYVTFAVFEAILMFPADA
jgi:hypothetical protein